jgi:hypothetical protein
LFVPLPEICGIPGCATIKALRVFVVSGLHIRWRAGDLAAPSSIPATDHSATAFVEPLVHPRIRTACRPHGPAALALLLLLQALLLPLVNILLPLMPLPPLIDKTLVGIIARTATAILIYSRLTLVPPRTLLPTRLILGNALRSRLLLLLVALLLLRHGGWRTWCWLVALLPALLGLLLLTWTV